MTSPGRTAAAPSTAWTAALNDYESFLDGLEAALAEGEWDDPTEPWSPPPAGEAEGALGAASDEEAARFRVLQARAAALQADLEVAMATVREELAGGDRRRSAARSYLQADTGVGENPPRA